MQGQRTDQKRLFTLILHDKIGSPSEHRKTLVEDKPWSTVKFVAKKIKPRLDRKLLYLSEGREVSFHKIEKEQYEAWLESHQP